LYSAINVIGLAIGLACCILITIFVRYELSYDRHYANADRIYRISRDFFTLDGSPRNLLAANAPVVAELLELDFPQIEAAARITCCPSIVISRSDVTFYEQGALADNELLEIFDFDWLHGDPSRALSEPYTLVLTESAARKYFGDEPAMGQVLTVENQWPVRVTGVIRDLPENTHLDFDYLLSLPTAVAVYGEQYLEGWSSNNFHTYVLLEDGADIEEIQSQSDAFFERHFEPGSSAYTGYTAFSLPDIHLRSNRAFEMGFPGSISTIYAFSAIAAFVLLIACINFVNLSTARSMQRAKEVGVRKAVGAHRARLVRQFLGESILIVLVAIILALLLVELALPVFSNFVQRDLVLEYFGDGSALPLLGLLALTIGIVAGSYPAFYLSSFEPARVLKGDTARGGSAFALRRLLVVLQFSISITLMIATAVVYSQMRYADNIDLGYDKDQIVVLAASPTVGFGSEWTTFRQQLLAHPEIAHVTASRLTPGSLNSDSTGLLYEGGGPGDRSMPFMFVDYDFFETYEIELLAGRTFSEKFGNDWMARPTEGKPRPEAAYILNELATRQMGWGPEEAIGKWLEISFFDTPGEVVGVVADVHFESMHSAIKPIIYMIPPAQMFGAPSLMFASIRITGRDLGGTLEHIDATWAQFVPGVPVNRRFLDEDFESLYLSEHRQAQLLTFFSVLAILVACLGLFGVALFSTEKRKKEIGIRKVAGGSTWSIVGLLTAEFSRLVLIACVVAWPVVYLAMRAWLENFAYRIGLSPLMFAGGGLAALLVAWLTVGGVAFRAATIKPAEALRDE
jgi:putative ABC transport system permease protein